MRLASIAPGGLLYLLLLFLSSFSAQGEVRRVSPIHPVKKPSVSEPSTGKLGVSTDKLGDRVTLVNQVGDRRLDPVKEDLDAYNELKSGQPSRSLLDLSSTRQVLFQDDFSHPDSMAER